MSSSELDLQLVTNWMTTISLFILIFLGLSGCLCNIIIFTSKQLKKNSCAFYFLCTASFEFFILCFGGISRLAAEHFGITLLNQNRIFCKIRSYLITTVASIATYLILLAAIDRCMTTSVHVHYRAFSQKKIAYRVVLVLIIIAIVVNVHSLIFFDLQPSCIPQPGVYALFYSIYLIVCTSILPDGLILIFTFWTFQNAKELRTRMAVNSMTNTIRQRSQQRMETHLVIMMLAQASVSVLLDFTRVSCYTYYFLTANIPKTSYQKTVAVFIFQFSNVLLYLNYSKSFYIYTLASHLFRKIFCEIIHNYYRELFRFLHLSNVHPVADVQLTDNEFNGLLGRSSTGSSRQ